MTFCDGFQTAKKDQTFTVNSKGEVAPVGVANQCKDNGLILVNFVTTTESFGAEVKSRVENQTKKRKNHSKIFQEFFCIIWFRLFFFLMDGRWNGMWKWTIRIQWCKHDRMLFKSWILRFNIETRNFLKKKKNVNMKTFH